jgi:hypothetical protein
MDKPRIAQWWNLEMYQLGSSKSKHRDKEVMENSKMHNKFN